MWIVRLALRRPYTFVVASILVAILGIVTILNMSTDVFPVIDIPVISIAFNYTGMSPEDMETRVVSQYERILTTTVNDIEHIESQSLYGIGIIKAYFQPNAVIENANAQTTAIAQTAIRLMPTGTQPPLIIEYNASNVPVLQLSISSDTLPEAQLFDLAFQRLRNDLITIPGVQIPYPYGGKQRQLLVDLDPQKLNAYGISPTDVSNAVNAQSLILPAGTTKINQQEYQVKLNASPTAAEDFNNLPIKTVNGTTIYVRDVAHVRDGFQVQTNVVHADGKASVLLSILKSGNASTLDVVDGVLKALPDAKTRLPSDLKITPLFDQSIFVRASVEGVIKEASIAAGLTALMILLFLGSWRSTLIVVISIPLSILVSIITMAALNQTLNVMTLGGLALAVGILVDDATVEIENIHRNLHQRKRLVQAILDGASQIAVPAFVSTLCICIVFVPVVFISGAAKFLFTPLAMAVVFAMLTSYLLSRTLVPTMVHYLLAAEVEMYGGEIDKDDPHAQKLIQRQEALSHGTAVPEEDLTLSDKLRRLLKKPWARLALLVIGVLFILGMVALIGGPIAKFFPKGHAALAGLGKGLVSHWQLATSVLLSIVILIAAIYLVSSLNLIWRTHYAFNRQFEKLRLFYGGILAWSLLHPFSILISFILLVVASVALSPAVSLFGMHPLIGQDFFPTVDAGQLRLHVRCPPGTRIEQSATYFAGVEAAIRKIIPKDEIAVVLDNIGIPNSSINLSLSDGSLMSPADGEINISLTPEHSPSETYMNEMRVKLPHEFPQLSFFFAPADIVTQVLNFGLQAPIDVQVTGLQSTVPANEKVADAILADCRKVPGVVDVRRQQVHVTPDIRVNVDRTLASQVGVTQRDVANDLLVSLSSSNQTAPNFWLSPTNGVSYSIFVQTPQYKIDSINDLQNTPIVPTSATPTVDNTQLLSNLATLEHGTSPTNITHYNIKPSSDVLMNVDGTDLETAANAVQQIVAKHSKDLPGGSKAIVRGQVQSMQTSFTALSLGMIFAVTLVYLLLVINFQSWIDPLIILMALPGAISGILWMLFITGTNISVPALMGAIMSIGVATANSILMITFANDQRKEGMNAHDAALAAGLTRLRPVVMTALAMIIGMLPMSLGLGEGGEQNAPLGRAVIGGLTLATFTTLIFVPLVYSRLRVKAPQLHVEKELQE